MKESQLDIIAQLCVAQAAQAFILVHGKDADKFSSDLEIYHLNYLEWYAKCAWDNLYTNNHSGRKQLIWELNNCFPERLISTLNTISRTSTVDNLYYQTFYGIIKFWYKNSKKD